jgi:hypothetical protein
MEDTGGSLRLRDRIEFGLVRRGPRLARDATCRGSKPTYMDCCRVYRVCACVGRPQGSRTMDVRTHAPDQSAMANTLWSATLSHYVGFGPWPGVHYGAGDISLLASCALGGGARVCFSWRSHACGLWRCARLQSGLGKSALYGAWCRAGFTVTPSASEPCDIRHRPSGVGHHDGGIRFNYSRRTRIGLNVIAWRHWPSFRKVWLR